MGLGLDWILALLKAPENMHWGIPSHPPSNERIRKNNELNIWTCDQVQMEEARIVAL